jgi:hypothetical protein
MLSREWRSAGFRHVNYKVAVEPDSDLLVAEAIRDEARGGSSGRTPTRGSGSRMPAGWPAGWWPPAPMSWSSPSALTPPT